MRLSSRYESVFHTEMYADGVRLEPAAAPQLKVRWFGHSLDPEEILVERLSVRFPTLRHGQLNVVQSKNRHEYILPELSSDRVPQHPWQDFTNVGFPFELKESDL